MSGSNFTATLAAGSSVTIGQDRAIENRIGIVVSADPAGSGSEKLWLQLDVETGGQPGALIASLDTTLDVRLSSGQSAEKIFGAPSKGKHRIWTTPKPLYQALALPGPGAPLELHLGGFISETQPGDAVLTLSLWQQEGSGWAAAPQVIEVKVPKIEPPGQSRILYYLSATQDFLLHGGDEITLSFAARGYDTYGLYRNNRLVTEWKDSSTKAQPTAGSFTDSPSITTVYQLRANYPEDGEIKTDRRSLTVQVISPGWNRVAPPQGYPLQLFAHDDFGGSGSELLYGIFMGPGGMPELFASQTGVDDWLDLNEPPPPHMATAPGVAFDNRLWLIGGSSYDANAPGTEVWCYEADAASAGQQGHHWVRRPELELGQVDGGTFKSPPGRMGHALVAVPGDTAADPAELWLMGGFENGTFYKDVWILREDRWLPPDPSKPIPWAGRYMHCAAAPRFRAGGKPEVWLYGGIQRSTDSGAPLEVICTDLWSFRRGGSWVPHDGFKPDQGAPLGATFVLNRASEDQGSRPQDRLFLAGTFLQPPDGAARGRPVPLDIPKGRATSNVTDSRIYEYRFDNDRWEAREVINGWERFEGAVFQMNASAFNRFLFVWSLAPGIRADQPPKLNIFVPT